jgi:hypothetical protein
MLQRADMLNVKSGPRKRRLWNAAILTPIVGSPSHEIANGSIHA